MLGKLFDRTTSSMESFDYIHQLLHGWGSQMASICHALVKFVKEFIGNCTKILNPIPPSQGWIFWERSVWGAHTPQNCLNPPEIGHSLKILGSPLTNMQVISITAY